MTRLVLQGLGQTAVVLFGVTVIVFAVLRIMPGDPVSLMFSGDDDAGNLAAREEYAAMLGLDRPLPVQYLSFLEDVSQGDLGKLVLEAHPIPDPHQRSRSAKSSSAHTGNVRSTDTIQEESK